MKSFAEKTSAYAHHYTMVGIHGCFLHHKILKEGKRNDQDIIDFLSGKVKGEVIKAALREYMENHKEELE